MSAAFHLRPVSNGSASPSTSTSTASELSPPPNFRPSAGPTPPSAAVGRPRRPLSPSSLRDVDLPIDNDMVSRKYPAPPTGHELMALFPPAPPVNIRPGPTSGYFEREERAFFARAGKEIVRVRIEVDMPQGSETEDPKGRGQDSTGAPLPWPSGHPHALSRSPNQAPPSAHPSAPFPHPNASRAPRGVPVPMATQPPFPAVPHGHAVQPPPNVHPQADIQHTVYPLRAPHEHHATMASQIEVHADEFRDDPDESWRRPMPHNERRRAGKHTKRVIVK
ncbi:hypothetical protein AcV5_010302 [Taiwanofungus camphoratus]|nr:hypothetical protein AcV5_010302 [Antrodia cinnamomea]